MVLGGTEDASDGNNGGGRKDEEGEDGDEGSVLVPSNSLDEQIFVMW